MLAHLAIVPAVLLLPALAGHAGQAEAPSGGAKPAAARQPASVKGTLTANGQTLELPYVYVHKLEKGFYDPADPAWKLRFVQHAVAERMLDEPIWDAAFVDLGVTRTAEFGGPPALRVYSQNLKLSAKAGASVSGGTYPLIELESTGPERFAGRVYLPEQQKLLGDTFQYDFTFSAPLSNPDAPIGDPLPADGGEPGQAYRTWVAAVHASDLGGLAKLVPADMASQLEGEDAKQELALMATTTPAAIKVLGGSCDGQTALLQIEGVLDGKTVRGEVTLQKTDGFWIPTGSSW